MIRILAVTVPLLLASCASDPKKDSNTGANPPEASNGAPLPSVDRSRCDPSGKKVVEFDLNNDGKGDEWKYYASIVENGAKVDVLTCKEMDADFDGKKDFWTYYDNGGNITLEEFDFDHDGKVDEWVYRQNGKIIRKEVCTGFDGRPDTWKFYDNDKLVRIERSRKRNGKIDMWEYYEGDKLDRVGYDESGSGQVTRWDRAPEESTAQAAATPPAEPGPSAQPPAPVAPPKVTPESGQANPGPAPKKK